MLKMFLNPLVVLKFFFEFRAHFWIQKGKDDLADISVIFFLYALGKPVLTMLQQAYVLYTHTALV